MQSAPKCANGLLLEDGSCQEGEVVKRSIQAAPQARNDVNVQGVLDGLLSPATISNHFTDILLFQSILAIGWFTACKYLFLVA